MIAFPLRDVSSCVKSFQKAWWWMLSILGGLFPLQQLHLTSLLLIKGNIDVGAVLESCCYSLQARSLFFYPLSYPLRAGCDSCFLLFVVTKRKLQDSQSGSLY